MTTIAVARENSKMKETQKSNDFEAYLMFSVIKHVHLLGLTRLKYLHKMLNKALDKCDAIDAKDPWHYHPEREFYSLSFGAVKRYLEIAVNTKEIQRLVKLKKYEVAQQLFERTERLKLEAKEYVLKNDC